MIMLNESALWLVNKESQNLLINRLITPRETSKPSGFTIKMNSRGIGS